LLKKINNSGILFALFSQQSMRKKICTYFLLLVLGIQVLPLQQMGSLLFSNQFNEEIPHAQEADNGPFNKAVIKSDFLSAQFFALSSVHLLLTPKNLPIADAIPQNHAGDILVPPPNC
jgi:hypothetical protein